MMNAKFVKFLLYFGIVLYFFFLVLSRVPAGWGAWAVHKAIPNFWLTGVTGTIWRGAAKGSQIDIGQSSLPIGEVSWNLNPMSLVMLAPCLTVKTSMPGQMVSGKLCHSLAGTSKVSNLSVEAPANIFNDLLPFPVAGQASLQVINGSLSSASVTDLDARFSLQEARVDAGEAWLPLGSIAATMEENQNGGVNVKIFDIDGPLTVAFDASWQPEQGLTAQGTVTPKTNAATEITSVLSVIGEEEPAGTYKLQWP